MTLASPVWKNIHRYPRVSLKKERHLIAKAQAGSKKSAQEIVLRHIGFVVFRLHKRGFPDLIRRHGEDLVSNSIPLQYQKIGTYNLRYRDSKGRLKPVRFVSYIWKRVDGYIIDYLKREALKERREVSMN